MDRKEIAPGVVQLSLSPSAPLINFNPANYPVEPDKSIHNARLYVTNALINFHLISNAQALRQFIPNILGTWCKRTLSFLCQVMSKLDRERLVGGIPCLVVHLELLQGEEEKQEEKIAESDLLPATKKIVGYRIFFYVNDQEFKFEKQMTTIWDENNRQKPDISDHMEIKNLDTYAEMIAMKNGRSAANCMDECKRHPLTSPENPLNPGRVFGIKYALNRCSMVCESQRNIHNYVRAEPGGGLKNIFPHPELTIRLLDAQTAYNVLINLRLPTPTSLSNVADIRHRDFPAWKRLMVQAQGEEDEGVPLMGCEETFRTVCGSNSPETVAYAADLVKDQMDAERKIVDIQVQRNRGNKALSDEDRQKAHRILMNGFHTLGIDQFRTVWNRYATISPYLKCAVEFYENHLEKYNGTMYFPRDRFSTNLSTWSEIVIDFLNGAETVLEAATCQQNLLRAQLSVLDALNPHRENKLHYFARGDAAVSKSFVLTYVQRLAVPGMVMNFTYKTLKADAVAGIFDERVEIYHELPLATIGTGHNGKAQETEQLTMMKELMTSGFLRFATIKQDEKTKNRINEQVCVSANGVVMGATNAEEVNDALESRTVTDNYKFVFRPGRTIVHLLCAPKNRSKKAVSAETIYFFQWMHMMNALLNQMIKCGVMEEAKTPFTQIMLPLVLEEAQKLGVTKANDKPRVTARLLLAVQVAIKWRAIYLMFCSEISPFRGERRPDGTYKGVPFVLEHMLICQYLMLDNDPAIFTNMLLGLYRSEFDTDEIYYVIEGIKKLDLQHVSNSSPDRNNAEQKGEEKKSSGSRRLFVIKTEYYYIVDGIFTTSSRHDSDQSKLEVLTTRIRLAINPVPKRREIITALKFLMGQFIEVEAGQPLLPAFEITDRGYKILIKIADENKIDRLEKAVQTVMQHKLTVPGDHLVSGDIGTIEPCDFKILRLEPNMDKELKFKNLDFYPANRMKILKAGLRHTPVMDRINEAYSKQKTTAITDIPLEVSLTLEHWRACGATEQRLAIYNISTERKMQALLIAEHNKSYDEYTERVQQAMEDYKTSADDIRVREFAGPEVQKLFKYDPIELAKQAKELPEPSPAALESVYSGPFAQTYEEERNYMEELYRQSGYSLKRPRTNPSPQRQNRRKVVRRQ